LMVDDKRRGGNMFSELSSQIARDSPSKHAW
jgi:hypothetical protein